jgi:cysteine-rich repeat protein
LLLFRGATDAAAATVQLVMNAGQPDPGESIMGSLMINTTAPLGAYTVEISCNASLLEIVKPVAGGAGEFSGNPTQNVSGCNAILSAFQASRLDGPTGAVHVARVTFKVKPTTVPGSVIPITITIEELVDTEGATISAAASPAQVEVGGVSAACGDGFLGNGEQCDDGNRTNGDCCSSACTFESGACDDANLCTMGDTCAQGACSGTNVAHALAKTKLKLKLKGESKDGWRLAAHLPASAVPQPPTTTGIELAFSAPAWPVYSAWVPPQALQAQGNKFVGITPIDGTGIVKLKIKSKPDSSMILTAVARDLDLAAASGLLDLDVTVLAGAIATSCMSASDLVCDGTEKKLVCSAP